MKDENEESDDNGQRVRDSFPLADVVINASSEDSIRSTCERFIRGFFGDNFISPSIDEYGIFLAKSASLRSVDLSRQVGAVITAQDGNLITVGCNEIPKAGGGFYWEGDKNDARDFKIGHDPSHKFKEYVLEDTIGRLKKSWLNDKMRALSVGQILEKALYDNENPIMKSSFMMDILEFGRVVHAEMAAISDSARRGLSIDGATLYCTTFPCHLCARHIVASGIKRVVYLEPYSKSLAADLYPDSISMNGKNFNEDPKVVFDQFVGIAPARFVEVFEKGKRKDDHGKARIWMPSTATPILKRLVPAYLHIETGVVSAFGRLIREQRKKQRYGRRSVRRRRKAT